ncbi:MAG: ketopantoate reductase family protein [Candidatus Puniceispirillum sp.]|uniref:ketopantoate reductase family protein n=1 Tax=uncultured Candidatus Puniceispirillum sp. TaxID=1985115 RepID=UPI002A71F50B|nr:ketopantoate reductase family protein [Candidatus Puniceispirillum sp.]
MVKTQTKVMVMGAGGMGALFGMILDEGGMDVTLVDHDEAHVAAIQKQGLKISGLGGERTRVMRAVTSPKNIDDIDIVLVQCKGTSTRTAAENMKHLAKQNTVFISFQNGLGNEDILGEILGTDNVLGGLTSMAGARLGAGHIQDFDRVPTYIGEMQGGISPRVDAIATAFTAAGLETKPSADINADIWKKLIGNLTMSAVSGITNLTSTEILNIEALHDLCYRGLDEAISIAQSQHVNLDKNEVIAGLKMMTQPGGTGDNKSSLCLDILAQRQSELEFIYGRPLALAKKANLNVPTLHTLYGLVKGIETHYVKG